MKLSDSLPLILLGLGLIWLDDRPPPVLAPPCLSDEELGRIFEEAFDAIFRKRGSISSGETEIPLLDLKPSLVESIPDSIAIEAKKWLSVIQHPCVAVILGKKGSGKTALAYRLIELLKWIAPVCVVGLPDSVHKYLPDWIEVQPSLDNVSPNCIVMVDEVSLQYHSHSSMTTRAKELSQILNLSRQRGQTLIFISQESRHTDRNILSATDVLIFKEPGLFQSRFDRPELREIATQASQAFQSLRGNRKRWSFVFTQDQGYVGLIENSPPSFWSDKLSRAFASEGVRKAKPAKKLTRTERQAQAKDYKKKGFIPAQIARMMGLSKPTIKNYLDDYSYK